MDCSERSLLEEFYYQRGKLYNEEASICANQCMTARYCPSGKAIAIIAGGVIGFAAIYTLYKMCAWKGDTKATKLDKRPLLELQDENKVPLAGRTYPMNGDQLQVELNPNDEAKNWKIIQKDEASLRDLIKKIDDLKTAEDVIAWIFRYQKLTHKNQKLKDVIPGTKGHELVNQLRLSHAWKVLGLTGDPDISIVTLYLFSKSLGDSDGLEELNKTSRSTLTDIPKAVLGLARMVTNTADSTLNNEALPSAFSMQKEEQKLKRSLLEMKNKLVDLRLDMMEHELRSKLENNLKDGIKGEMKDKSMEEMMEIIPDDMKDALKDKFIISKKMLVDEIVNFLIDKDEMLNLLTNKLKDKQNLSNTVIDESIYEMLNELQEDMDSIDDDSMDELLPSEYDSTDDDSMEGMELVD